MRNPRVPTVTAATAKQTAVTVGAGGAAAVVLCELREEGEANLAAALREETGAEADDPMPDLIAGQIGRAHIAVTALIGRETVKGCKTDEVSREVLALLDDMEQLLSDRVLNYAVRDH